MSTTDSRVAEVAFDATRPFRTRDGREVLLWDANNFEGFVDGRRCCWWSKDGRLVSNQDGPLDLVNVDPAPVEPAGGAEDDETLLEWIEPKIRAVLEGPIGDRNARLELQAILVRLSAADPHLDPDPNPDLETAITTLLAQIGSSHEAHPGAKRDLVRAFVARHGAGARGEVGAGDEWPPFKPCATDYPEGGMTEFVQADVSIVWVPVRNGIEAGYDMDDRTRLVAVRWPLARRGARAPVAGGEPVALRLLREHHEWHLSQGEDNGELEGVDLGEAYAESDLCTRTYEMLGAHPPAPPAPTAERAPETARELLARADMLLHDAEGDDESMAHGLVHDAAAFLSDREEVRANVRAQYAKPNPPHGHQAPPAAPVGGVTEALAREESYLTTALINAECMDGPGFMVGDIAGAFQRIREAFAARPTPDDGCPKGDPDCLGDNGDCHDACSTFAERGAVAAEREACEQAAWRLRQKYADEAGKHGGDARLAAISLGAQQAALAIRSRASTPAAIDGLAPGGRDGTEG